MANRWEYLLTRAAVWLDASLVLVGYCRDVGPLMLLGMYPFVAASLAPSALAALGARLARGHRKGGLAVLALLGVMAALSVTDLWVPTSKKGYDPELEAPARVLILLTPARALLGVVALAVGLASRRRGLGQSSGPRVGSASASEAGLKELSGPARLRELDLAVTAFSDEGRKTTSCRRLA